MNSNNILVIEPGKIKTLYWHDVWRYRELFYVLAWRDIAVKYKQTYIGLAWVLIRPIFTMIVFTIVFGSIAKLPSDGAAPYALMVYAGVLPWQFFSTCLLDSSNSLLDNSGLISKIYFPRIIVPSAVAITSLVDLCVGFSILGFLMLWYGVGLSSHIFYLPLFIAFLFFTSLGIGLFCASMNIKYRDFRYIVPFVIQVGFYISPVGFSSSVISDEWRLLFSLNPMVGIIDGFRWAILGNNSSLYFPGLLLSLIISIVLFSFGIWRFKSTERNFADLV